MPPENLDQLTRVYGPTTWDLYERLDVSLNPTGPDSLHDIAGQYLADGGVVLDAGCRNAEHLIRLATENPIAGVGVDPVKIHIEQARTAIEMAGVVGQITLHHGVMHDLPYEDNFFDFVWCRDVLEQIDDLHGALEELVRLMKPNARLLVYTTFATERLDRSDAEMLRRHLGNLDRNLNAGYVEAAFTSAGLRIERKDLIGTEWREYAEEHTQPVSRAMLRLSRLRRQRSDIIARHGQEIYEHVEANLHWEVFQFLGKLSSVVYLLTPGFGDAHSIPPVHDHESTR